MNQASIKVGVITDQTGPLSFLGIANANIARLVINDINSKGGLLGRWVDLYLEDSATTDSVAQARATKLVQQDKVDVIFGGIYSSTRQAIKGPAVVQGKKLYIYPEQYEGQESDPLIFCTGPVPAQQVDPFIPWLMKETGAKRFYLPSADYIWPHVMNKRVREVVTAHGGEIVGEEYFPLDHADYGRTVDKIMTTGAEVVFNTIVPPGLMPFLEQLHQAGFKQRGGHLVCTYFEENLLGLGTTGVRPFAAFAVALGHASVHLNGGYTWNGDSVLAGNVATGQKADMPDQASWAAGIDFGVTKRLTLALDVVGTYIIDSPRLVSQTFTAANGQSFPQINFVTESYGIVNGAAGLKVNLFGRLLLDANVLFKLNDAGLRDKVTPLIGIEYAF